ncbi:MAG: ribose 5-phosphate isomerase B [Christensenellales bacterium]|jgi:ribose 5-phosphate isomerase B
MIAVGSDHGGFELKQVVLEYLHAHDIEYRDLGCFSENSVDYPDVGLTVALSVASKEFDKGILFCGTGIGISIAANKVPGIRAALCSDTYSARMSKEHNNSNILVMGGRTIGAGVAIEILEAWLKAEFAGGRHGTRVDKISAIEKKYCAPEV